MASPNYALWKAAADKGEVRRATFVCGDQSVLVEEVVDTTRRQLGAGDLNYVVVSAGRVPDREVWAAVGQYPLDQTSNRLVVVRDAHRVKHWDPLTSWLTTARQAPHNYLLLVSGQDDLPTKMVDGKKVLADHVDAIRSARGRLVRCGRPNEADSVAWVRARSKVLDDETANYLLHRVGGDLSAAADAAAKIALFDRLPSTQIIDLLCEPAPAESFVDCVIARNKTEALLAAQTVPDSERGRMFALLDARLDLLASLYRATRAGLSQREIRDVPVFLIRKLMPYARHYDPHRCAFDRRLLAVLEGRHRSGIRVGVLEQLVALW